MDLKRRIFVKVGRGNLRDRLMVLACTGSEDSVNQFVGHVRIREVAFETNPVTQIVVNVGGTIILANERARSLFGIAPADLSRPLQDLQISYRPAELRSAVERTYNEHRSVVLKDVEWSLGVGEVSYFDVHVIPLADVGGTTLGASITYLDTTAAKKIAEEHLRSTRALETAYEELQSTNEELETTNEELQSTVEELETTSEELQSTNEELETMNEELQSTNEELETVNDEVRRRSDELKRLNAFLESILGSLRGGVVVVNLDLLILVWNTQVEHLWGLRAEEVRGRNLLNLDIGLPVVRLKPALLRCLAGEVSFEEIVLEAINRRGKVIACRVTCTPMTSAEGKIIGVILIMSDESETPATAEDEAVAERWRWRGDRSGGTPLRLDERRGRIGRRRREGDRAGRRLNPGTARSLRGVPEKKSRRWHARRQTPHNNSGRSSNIRRITREPHTMNTTRGVGGIIVAIIWIMINDVAGGIAGLAAGRLAMACIEPWLGDLAGFVMLATVPLGLCAGGLAGVAALGWAVASGRLESQPAPYAG